MIEIRLNDDVEIREQKEEETKEERVEGYGLVYDKKIKLFDGFYEIISKGAFREAVKDQKEIKAFVNHEAEYVLSTTKSDPPLVLREDEKGVFFSSPIPPTSYGNDLKVNLQRKNVRGASMAFKVNPNGDKWETQKDGTTLRTIIDARLYEIGPVTNPAYVQTHVELKKIKEEVELRKKDDSTEIECKRKENESTIAFERAKIQLEKEMF